MHVLGGSHSLAVLGADRGAALGDAHRIAFCAPYMQGISAAYTLRALRCGLLRDLLCDLPCVFAARVLGALLGEVQGHFGAGRCAEDRAHLGAGLCIMSTHPKLYIAACLRSAWR